MTAATVLEIQELPQRALDFVLKRVWEDSQFASEQRVVPGEHLVDENVAISRNAAGTSGYPNTQRDASPATVRVVSGSTTVLARPNSANSVG